jgi:HEAT repeat protein
MTYLAASGPGGGTYVIAWGAIVFGAIRFFQGLSDRNQKPGAENIGYDALAYATRLEAEGRVQEALAIYEKIAESQPETGAGRDARKSVENLQAKLIPPRSPGQGPVNRSSPEDYLRQLRAGDFESASRGLTAFGPAIVQPLVAAYQAETSPEIRVQLLRIICEFRTPLALPLLDAALRDRRDNRWRAALDGLVALASAEAVQILERVLREESAAPNPDSDYIEWVREALEQTREALKSNLIKNT